MITSLLVKLEWLHRVCSLCLFTMSIFTVFLAITMTSYKYLHQGKWWSAALASTASRVWSCSHPPTPAPSLICLKQGLATASPSCLGGGWSSVGGEMVLTTSTLASRGWQATPAGLPSTRWGASSQLCFKIILTITVWREFITQSIYSLIHIFKPYTFKSEFHTVVHCLFQSCFTINSS